MMGTMLLAAASEPDAVSKIARAYFLYFIGVVIVIPIIKLVIDLYHILKENGVIGRDETAIPVHSQAENPYEERNLIFSAYDKICEKRLGLESLTEEEKEALRKHGIDV